MIEVWTLTKATDKIPAAGRYKCIICGLIVEIEQKFIDNWASFFACPVCHAWEEWWAVWPADEVWEYLG